MMSLLAVFLFVLSFQITPFHAQTTGDTSLDIDPYETLVWGPGLQPEKAVFRSRYIFLQLRNSDSKNITSSPGLDAVTANIRGITKQNTRCPIWTEILDSNDGSFIVRYNVQKTCISLHLQIQVKDIDVVNISDISGPVHEEECYCPNNELESWLKNNNCSSEYSRIVQDLSPFRTVNFDNIRNSLVKEFHKPNSISFCHYIIKNNEIYRHCYGQHVGFKIFMDSTLLSITRKVVLPDIEFFTNLGDWPLVKKSLKVVYPMFSWCGSKDSWDITLPTYSISEASTEMMGRITLDMLSVQGNTNVEWKNKINKLFWRGRDSRRERLDLIDIARRHPDLINASITNFFFFRNEMDKYGPPEKHVSFFHFFKYKYQLNIDGSVAAYRLPFLLAGNSLVFKQDSDYYEFFYDKLTPGVHYISVKSSLSDLVEKIRWAMKNDEKAFEISKNGRQFTRDNLMPKDILCYHVVLFNEWSKRLKNKVTIHKDMEHVPQPDHDCYCPSFDEMDDSIEKDEL